MEKREDWLFPDAGKQRAELEEKGLVFAQKYLVFKAEPRARDLLAHWTALARKARIPANATLGEYAAANAFRELVEGIHSQIEFAENGLNQPRPRTTTNA